MLFSPVIRTMFQNTGVLATGGTITTYGPYKVHKFTSNGTFTLNRPATCYGLMVGGGGGGGVKDWDESYYGHAGGVTYYNFTLNAGDNPINVGNHGRSQSMCYPYYDMNWAYGGYSDVAGYIYIGIFGAAGDIGYHTVAEPGLTTTFYGVSLTNCGRCGKGQICGNGYDPLSGVVILAYLM